MTKEEIDQAQAIVTNLMVHINKVMSQYERAGDRISRFVQDDTLQIIELEMLVADFASVGYWASAAKADMNNLIKSLKAQKKEQRNVA